MLLISGYNIQILTFETTRPQATHPLIDRDEFNPRSLK